MAVVQYTFTHKQYTEQHNETEYIEQNIHKYINITIKIHNLQNYTRAYKTYSHIYSDKNGTKRT